MSGYYCLETSKLQVTERGLRRSGKPPQWWGVVSDCSAQPVTSGSSDCGSGQKQGGSALHTWHSPGAAELCFPTRTCSQSMASEARNKGAQVRPADLLGLGWAGHWPRSINLLGHSRAQRQHREPWLGLTSCQRNADLQLGTQNKSLTGEQLSERQIFAAFLPVYICSGVSPYECLVHVCRGRGSEEHTWAPNAAAAQLVVKLLGKDSQVQVPALLSPRKGREWILWSL